MAHEASSAPLKPILITKPNLLVVEGTDDKVFFEAFINHCGFKNFEIVTLEGKRQIRSKLNAIVQSPRFRDAVSSLGIVRDADEDAHAAFQSVRDALRFVGLDVPKKPLVSIGATPRVTILILPDNNMPGALENLCLKAVDKDPAMPCIEQFWDCLDKTGLTLPRNHPKGKVQTFLASRPESGKRLGEAAQAGYWPLDNPAFYIIRDFLQQVGG